MLCTSCSNIEHHSYTQKLWCCNVFVKWWGRRQTLCIPARLFPISEASPRFQCLGNQSLISFTPFSLAELELNGHCIKKYWGTKYAVTSSAIYLISHWEKQHFRLHQSVVDQNRALPWSHRLQQALGLAVSEAWTKVNQLFCKNISMKEKTLDCSGLLF